MDRSRRRLVGTAGAALVSVPTAVHCIGTAAVADLDRDTAAPGQVLTFQWSVVGIEPLPDQTTGPLITTIGQLPSGGEVHTTRTILSADRWVEKHVFMVPDGQLIGAGSITDRTGSFAILGGTGRYRNIAGQYQAVYDRADGLDTATFSFETTTDSD